MRVLRQLTAATCVLICFLFCAVGPACGDRLYFSRFYLDLPEGWKVFEQGPTVAVTADDGSSSMTITIETQVNVPLKQWAQNVSRQLNGNLPEWNGASYTISFVNSNGIIGVAVIQNMLDRGNMPNGDYLLIIVTGENPGLWDILDSLEEI